MYKRDVRLYLADIDEAIAAIEEYTAGLDYETFAGDGGAEQYANEIY